MLLWPDVERDTGTSFTSTATADVINGKNVITPKKILHLIIKMSGICHSLLAPYAEKYLTIIKIL
jgi:hypothetical protein